MTGRLVADNGDQYTLRLDTKIRNNGEIVKELYVESLFGSNNNELGDQALSIETGNGAELYNRIATLEADVSVMLERLKVLEEANTKLLRIRSTVSDIGDKRNR